MSVRLLFSVWLLIASAVGAAPDAVALKDPADYLFLDNGQVRLGVKKSSGAGIAWFSMSGSERNLINHWDRGRLVQQSYYGDLAAAREGGMTLREAVKPLAKHLGISASDLYRLAADQ